MNRNAKILLCLALTLSEIFPGGLRARLAEADLSLTHPEIANKVNDDGFTELEVYLNSLVTKQ